MLVPWSLNVLGWSLLEQTETIILPCHDKITTLQIFQVFCRDPIHCFEFLKWYTFICIRKVSSFTYAFGGPEFKTWVCSAWPNIVVTRDWRELRQLLWFTQMCKSTVPDYCCVFQEGTLSLLNYYCFLIYVYSRGLWLIWILLWPKMGRFLNKTKHACL